MLILVLGVLVAAVVLIARGKWWAGTSEAKSNEPGAESNPDPTAAGAATDEATPVKAGPGAAEDAPPTRKPRPAQANRIDNARRDKLIEGIRAAQKARASAAEGQPKVEQDITTDVTKELGDYVQSRLGTVIPLLSECSQLAAAPAGDIDVELTVEGDPDVGGIVTKAEVTGGPLAGSELLSQCVTETFMSVEFDPPAAGVKMTIRTTVSLGH